MKLGSHTVLFLLALMAGGWLGSSVWAAGERGNGLRRGTLDAFIEYGAAGHVGDNTPFWQTSLRHGLSALDDNTYLRAGAFYEGKTDDWHYDAGLDLAAAAGFTSVFVVQQAYVEAGWRWIELSVGSKEIDSPLLNQELSTGGMTWSGNARPIPQIMLCTPGYVQALHRWALKAEFSYGWFTDNGYQHDRVGEGFEYTTSIKYHHKSFFSRIGRPGGRWQFDVGMSVDVQFGGYKHGGADAGDLGNSLKDYFRVIFPLHGTSDSPDGEQIAYQGNFLGSEHLRLTYRHENFELSAYLENFYDDMSGMGKLNGADGLWGIEYKASRPQLVRGLVLEYLQTTDQSGPMHGLDYTIVNKTGGADDYYNNSWYPGWVHWGMAMGNPLLTSPVYNKDGDMCFKHTRVKAIHLGWLGDLAPEWRYVAKLTFSQTWGTPYKPTVDILENFSAYASFCYQPERLKGWRFDASVALDMGQIYGDNFGGELKVRKTF